MENVSIGCHRGIGCVLPGPDRLAGVRVAFSVLSMISVLRTIRQQVLHAGKSTFDM